jgi:hypothetical protein
MTQDVLVILQDNGADWRISGNDIEVVQGYENLPLLAMFSGDGDWWANSLLLQGNNYVSATETALKNNPLSSAGRVAIENAVKSDLAAALADIPNTTFSATVTITQQNRIDITITINGQTFYYNWNPSTGFANYSL